MTWLMFWSLRVGSSIRGAELFLVNEFTEPDSDLDESFAAGCLFIAELIITLAGRVVFIPIVTGVKDVFS